MSVPPPLPPLPLTSSPNKDPLSPLEREPLASAKSLSWPCIDGGDTRSTKEAEVSNKLGQNPPPPQHHHHHHHPRPSAPTHKNSFICHPREEEDKDRLCVSEQASPQHGLSSARLSSCLFLLLLLLRSVRFLFFSFFWVNGGDGIMRVCLRDLTEHLPGTRLTSP